MIVRDMTNSLGDRIAAYLREDALNISSEAVPIYLCYWLISLEESTSFQRVLESGEQYKELPGQPSVSRI